MRRTIIGLLIAGSAVVSTTWGSSPQAPPAPRGFMERYCLTCHSQASKEKGIVPLALDTLDLAKVTGDAEVWEKVVRKVSAGMMPPPGAPRPDAASTQNFLLSLTTELDRASEKNPNPGRPLLHRLNRTEYANAIHDLLDLNIDATDLLPPDDSAYGFDNISDALGLSPALQERYVSAAMKISALAMGDMRTKAGGTTYRVLQDVSQDQHLEGLPLGTVGG